MPMATSRWARGRSGETRLTSGWGDKAGCTIAAGWRISTLISVTLAEAGKRRSRGRGVRLLSFLVFPSRVLVLICPCLHSSSAEPERRSGGRVVRPHAQDGRGPRGEESGVEQEGQAAQAGRRPRDGARLGLGEQG